MNHANLPLPVGNGVGTAVEVASFMAALKTIQANLTPSFVSGGGVVHIEVSADIGVSWGPLVDFKQTDQETIRVCCSHMRTRVTGFKSGLIGNVGVGGEEGVTKFFDLPIFPTPPQFPPLSLLGPPNVDVSDAEYIKTFIVSGAFHGTLTVYIANNLQPAVNVVGGWAPLRSYTIPTTDEDVEVVCEQLWCEHKGGQAGDAPKVTVACSVPESELVNTLSLPHNVDLYVNASSFPVDTFNGGADSNPGTAAAPIQTFQRAMELAPPQWTGYCRIHWARGSYKAVSFAAPNYSPLAQAQKTFIGRPVGHLSTPMAWIGSYSTSSVLAGSSPPGPRVITATYAPYAVDASLSPGPFMSGATIRFTSGALSGQRFILRRTNSAGGPATPNYICFDSIAAAAIGDTFEVEGPDVNFLIGDFASWEIDGGGFGGSGGLSLIGCGFGAAFDFGFGNPQLIFSNLNLVCAGVFISTGFTGGFNVFINTRLASGIRDWCALQDASLFNPFFLGTRPLQAFVEVQNGGFAGGGLGMSDGSIVRLNNFVANSNGDMLINGGCAAYFDLVDFARQSGISSNLVVGSRFGEQRARAKFRSDPSNPSTFTNAGGFPSITGFDSDLWIDGLQINGSLGGIDLDGCKLYVDHLTGAVAAGSYGLAAKNGAQITSLTTSLAYGTTITISGGVGFEAFIGGTPTPYNSVPYTSGNTLCRIE